MPNLEEAIMNTMQNGNGSGSDSQSEEGSPESHGASRPSSPSPKSSSSRYRERQKGVELEIEQSYEGSPNKTPHAAGLASQAAQLFGNEAHQSSDIL